MTACKDPDLASKISNLPDISTYRDDDVFMGTYRDVVTLDYAYLAPDHTHWAVEIAGWETVLLLNKSIEYSADTFNRVRLTMIETVDLTVAKLLTNIDRSVPVDLDFVKYDRCGEEISRSSFKMNILRVCPTICSGDSSVHIGGWSVLLERV